MEINDTTDNANINLPRVSMILLVFQQEEYVKEAISGALAQDYSNLQIIISDDASTDHSVDIIMSEIEGYKGPHCIKVNLNEANLGIGNHFKFIMDNLIEGEVIVAAAGDDISAPNRVSRLVEVWLANGKPEVIAHGLNEIDQYGNDLQTDRTQQYLWQRNLQELSSFERLNVYLDSPYPIPFVGAALAYSRELYLRFGTPYYAPDYEDHLMYFRSLLGGDLFYLQEPLIYYRRHPNNFGKKVSGKTPEIIKLVLGENNLRIPSSGFSQYRFHILACQQFEDYIKALRVGLLNLDLEQALKLIRRITREHDKILYKHAGWKGKYNLISTDFRLLIRYLPSRWKYGVQRAANINYLSKIRIVIFGAGAAGQLTLIKLPEQFEVIAFSDNDIDLHGKKVLGVEVIPPSKLVSGDYSFDCILVASTYYFPIKKQLRECFKIPLIKISRAPLALITTPSAIHSFRRNTKLIILASAIIIAIVSLVNIL